MRPKRFQEGYRTGHLYARALDLDSMNPDPDTDQHFKWIRIQIWIRIQGFDDQKLKKKNTTEIFIYFFDQKLQFTYVQATGEASSAQRRTSSISKTKIYKVFSMFVGHFCLLYPDPQHCFGVCITLMRIRILLLIQRMRICDKWPTDPPALHFKPPHLHFEPRKLLNFDSNGDPDPAYKNNSDPRPCFILSVSNREEVTDFKRLTTVNCRVHSHT